MIWGMIIAGKSYGPLANVSNALRKAFAVPSLRHARLDGGLRCDFGMHGVLDDRPRQEQRGGL